MEGSGSHMQAASQARWTSRQRAYRSFSVSQSRAGRGGTARGQLQET